MDLIVSPTTVALNPQQSAAVPVLKAGDMPGGIVAGTEAIVAQFASTLQAALAQEVP